MEHDGSFGIGSGFSSAVMVDRGRHSESEYPAALATEILVYSQSPLQRTGTHPFHWTNSRTGNRGLTHRGLIGMAPVFGSFSGSQSSATYPTQAMHPFSYLQSPQTTGAKRWHHIRSGSLQDIRLFVPLESPRSTISSTGLQ
jgi:hypothetical protein